MNNHLSKGVIHIRDFRLWAHVGVLDNERLLGQWFELDLSIWKDLDDAAKNDDLSSSIDYSLAIDALHKLSRKINCHTIEHFSEKILDCLEDIYGPLPMKVFLRKCSAPVPGFTGAVEIERNRYLSVFNN